MYSISVLQGANCHYSTSLFPQKLLPAANGAAMQSQAAACQWLEVVCQMFEGHGMPYVAVVANKADTDPWKARATQLQASLPPEISCYRSALPQQHSTRTPTETAAGFEV